LNHNAPYPCVKCGEIKQVGKRCIPCFNAAAKRRYHQDVELSRAKSVARHSTEKSKQQKSVAGKVYYADNRDELIRKNLEWQRANPDKSNAKRERWRKKFPEKVSAEYRLRRDIKLAATGSHTDDEWIAVKIAQDYKCFDCKLAKKLTVGHLVPWCLGGSDYISNIVAQCQSCNSKQGKNVHYSVEPMAASF
jgi:5-methylcytosine-specific restriction endonuclease McrA